MLITAALCPNNCLCFTVILQVRSLQCLCICAPIKTPVLFPITRVKPQSREKKAGKSCCCAEHWKKKKKKKTWWQLDSIHFLGWVRRLTAAVWWTRNVCTKCNTKNGEFPFQRRHQTPGFSDIAGWWPQLYKGSNYIFLGVSTDDNINKSKWTLCVVTICRRRVIYIRGVSPQHNISVELWGLPSGYFFLSMPHACLSWYITAATRYLIWLWNFLVWKKN